MCCRDLLNVLGMYPGDPGPPGGDCSGVVAAVGSNVTALRPGDAVFGLAGGSLGSHVHTHGQTGEALGGAMSCISTYQARTCVQQSSIAPSDAPRTTSSHAHVPPPFSHVLGCSAVVPVPANLSFEEAATCPTVFITVDSAFRQAAAVQPGERVLMHAAAGGVGLAAIQMVAALGGTVVATAGSPNKRALVRSLGAQIVLGSRDTTFAAELAELGGASVVLNSLTSAGMVAGSLAAMTLGARFVEISKRDIHSAKRIAQGEQNAACRSCGVGQAWAALRLVCQALSLPIDGPHLLRPAERPDVRYSLVAVDFLPPPAVNASLSRLSRQLADGVLVPLPQVVHSLAEVRAALRQMSQARHVGKIVVRAAAGEAAKAPAGYRVLVTGGLGTLGSLTAAWVAQNSQLHAHATGRTGRFASDVSEGTTGSLAALLAAEFGGALTLTTADAGSSEDAALLLAPGAASTPVVGVLHASGVLADATLRNQSLKGLRTAWAPKVAALAQLSGATGRQPGTFSLLFSSVAALLGSPGQANYSAANAALDALSEAAQTQVSGRMLAGSATRLALQLQPLNLL